MTSKSRFPPSLTAAATVLAFGLSMPSAAQCVANSALIEEKMGESKATETIWPQDSCDKLQEAAGIYIYFSGEALRKAHESTDPAFKDKSFGAGVALSQLSANAASIYEVFCDS